MQNNLGIINVQVVRAKLWLSYKVTAGNVIYTYSERVTGGNMISLTLRMIR